MGRAAGPESRGEQPSSLDDLLNLLGEHAPCGGGGGHADASMSEDEPSADEGSYDDESEAEDDFAQYEKRHRSWSPAARGAAARGGAFLPETKAEERKR